MKSPRCGQALFANKFYKKLQIKEKGVIFHNLVTDLKLRLNYSIIEKKIQGTIIEYKIYKFIKYA